MIRRFPNGETHWSNTPVTCIEQNIAILKHLKSAHFSTKNGYFSVFCGSISHAFSCKQETHDLLTLVSYIIIKYKRCLQNPQPEFRKIVEKYYGKVIL